MIVSVLSCPPLGANIHAVFYLFISFYFNCFTPYSACSVLGLIQARGVFIGILSECVVNVKMPFYMQFSSFEICVNLRQSESAGHRK